MNWLFKKRERPQYHIPNVGTFELVNEGKDYYWRTLKKQSLLDSNLEVEIEMKSKIEPTQMQIKSLNNFLGNWPKLKESLFEFAQNKFDSNSEKYGSLEVRQFFNYATVTLEKGKDNSWLVILEPSFRTPSVFNHFIRFTIVENRIEWSNLK